VRVDERVFLGVGVVVTNGFSFSCVSLSTTRLLAGGDVSRVLQVRFPRSVAIATADLGLVSLASASVVLVVLAVFGVACGFGKWHTRRVRW
jgi:hypothetical protein